MENKYNPKLVHIANILRKNMTREEKHLWYDFLHTYPVRFYRQKVLGKYVADFYCAKAKLVIELDGLEHCLKKTREYDRQRTEYFQKYGIQVVRIPNTEIRNNFQGVCDYIDHAVRNALS